MSFYMFSCLAAVLTVLPFIVSASSIRTIKFAVAPENAAIADPEHAVQDIPGVYMYIDDEEPPASSPVVGTIALDESFNETGWDYLHVRMYETDVEDSKAMSILGLGEGFITRETIYYSWLNTMKGYCDWKGEEFCNKLRTFVKANNAWMKTMIETHADTDPYWHMVNLILMQLEGLVKGYNYFGDFEHIDYENFMLMNLAGDLEDLEPALGGDSFRKEIRGDGHCSAIIKLLNGNADLYTSHVTWNSLQSMLRSQKRYEFPFRMTANSTEKVPGSNLTFSSYPGVLYSGDDYYTLSTGLVTMETTIGNSNPDLWSNVHPEGEVMEWIRTLVANRLAVDGKSWSDIFKRYNSGTYNNQWMVVDYNKFVPFTPLRPNTLWVLEQLPGLIVAEDQTQLLQKQTYWPSYNVPFYPEVFNMSGLPALVDKYGDWFSYDKTPRALIFARDHSKVKDLGSLIKLMRYNNFKEDPLSGCDCTPPYSGENAISARCDLNPANGTYPISALGHRSHVGTDVKVTSSELVKKSEFLAVNGPTHDDLPVFQWSTSDFANDTSHFGHPDIFDFPVYHYDWPMPNS